MMPKMAAPRCAKVPSKSLKSLCATVSRQGAPRSEIGNPEARTSKGTQPLRHGCAKRASLSPLHSKGSAPALEGTGRDPETQKQPAHEYPVSRWGRPRWEKA